MNDTTLERAGTSATTPSLASREVQARVIDVDEHGQDLQGRRYVVVESAGGAIALVSIYVDQENARFGRARTRWVVRDTDDQPGIVVQVEALRRAIERRVLDTVFSRSDWQVFEWHQVSAGSSLEQALRRRFMRVGGYAVEERCEDVLAGELQCSTHRFERAGFRAAIARIRSRLPGLKAGA